MPIASFSNKSTFNCCCHPYFTVITLVDGKIVSPEKLVALRHECDELLAIFVTIIKRSKDTS